MQGNRLDSVFLLRMVRHGSNRGVGSLLSVRLLQRAEFGWRTSISDHGSVLLNIVAELSPLLSYSLEAPKSSLRANTGGTLTQHCMDGRRHMSFTFLSMKLASSN